MRRSIVLSIIAVVVLATLSFLPACTGTKPEKPVVLRLTCAYSETDQIGGGSIEMAKRFNERTKNLHGGMYTFESHTGGTLTGLAETLDAVRTGSVEMGLWPPGVFSMAEVTFASAEVPFAFNNVEANIAACHPMVPLYSAVTEKKFNQKVLGLFTATSLDLCSTKQVKTMEDWKGLLIQAIAPACAAVAENLGGSSVSIPWPDAYSSLDKGVVDGGLYATNQMNQYKLYEVTDYLVPVYMVPTFVATSVNLDVWNKLPKDIQDILADEHTQYCDDLNDIWAELVYELPDILAGHGMEVYWLPQAERERWKAACKPYSDSVMDQLDADFVKKFTKIVDEANAKYPYVKY